ncbi:uncharacterized protein G2W53_013601 [Senna tora]|uniref:Uncharacterized protein n=1 Tax=Senna tora TaxID=362788 RepID=A0A834TYX7_9FABA|nr:uncharacterized protein G2W53_013601 [Senna tora]
MEKKRRTGAEVEDKGEQLKRVSPF